MSYSHANGRGKFFKNDNKKSENSPDYSGKATLPDGRPIIISGWKNGDHINLKIEFAKEKGEEEW